MIVVKLNRGMVDEVCSDRDEEVVILDGDVEGMNPNDLEVIDGKLIYVYRMESKPLCDGKLPDPIG